MQEAIAIPEVGQLWAEQGGIFVGSRVINGKVHHMITPSGVEHDKKANFDKIESGEIKFGEINGFSDWFVPEQEDLMLGWINARDHFEQHGYNSIYWSRSFHHDWPWAVAFETGIVYSYYRLSEFRVRPFRSIIASSI